VSRFMCSLLGGVTPEVDREGGRAGVGRARAQAGAPSVQQCHLDAPGLQGAQDSGTSQQGTGKPGGPGPHF
jgi:hypothetical protein